MLQESLRVILATVGLAASILLGPLALADVLDLLQNRWARPRKQPQGTALRGVPESREAAPWGQETR